MSDNKAVPDDRITLKEDEYQGTEEDSQGRWDSLLVRPGGDPVIFNKQLNDSSAPYVVVDLEEENNNNGYAHVYAIKLLNSNVGSVIIQRQETDGSPWVDVGPGTFDVDASGMIEIPLAPVQMGKIKVTMKTIRKEGDEHYEFDMDIAVCGYGYGK